MDEQTLERLMIDDALGTLTSDVRALLIAYVRTRDDGEKELSQWQSLGTAAQASVLGEEITPPPMRVLRVARFRYVARMATAAAAILAIGFALGIGVRRQPAPLVSEVPVIVSATEHVPPVSAGSDFWSSQRLMTLALQTEHNAHSPPQWTWPATQRNSGETR